MKFLIGFNLVALVLWYLYACNVLKTNEAADFGVKAMTTIVMEVLTIILTSGIHLMVTAF